MASALRSSQPTQPLSFSHLFLQLLLEATDNDVISHAPYIISLVQQSATFEPNKQVSDDILKSFAQNCLNQQQAQSQTATQLTNLVNAGNQPLSLLFQRFANLFLQVVTAGTKHSEPQSLQSILVMSPETKQRITTGLSLLDLFISQCDFAVLQSSANYLYQIIFAFIRQQQALQSGNDAPLPTSLYLKALHLLTKLYIRASTPGWGAVFQSLPAIRAVLDSLFAVAMKVLPLSAPNTTTDGESSPHFCQLKAYHKPIQSITPGEMAVLEYILHILLSLYQHNGTRPALKTHFPQTTTLLFSLCDLDIHAQSYTTLQSLGQTRDNKMKSSQSNRLLPLMGHIFALACYSAKFNDVKQSLTNFTTTSKHHEPLLLAFPSDIFLLGLQAQAIRDKAKKEHKSIEELSNKRTDLDTFLTTHKNDDGNGILIDTTKTAKKAISGLDNNNDTNLSLTGGTVTKHLNARQVQGSQHLLQMKVAADDEIAEGFLTDEFQTTQQIIYNRQQQVLHLDLKRCVAIMLVTTIVNHLIAAVPCMMAQHATLTQISESLLQSQRNAGFIAEQPLAFVLPSLPQHINTETIPHQQLITSRTLALFSLLQALVTISPSSLQANGDISTTYSNLQWLGFGGAGATFMQATHRELFNSTSSNKQSGQQLFAADKSGNTSVTTGSEFDQVVVLAPPTLPTSLSMSFGTQNEQFHVQQQNQQHFQFEFPLFRVLQLFYVIFEIELNPVCLTKELFYLNQFIPPLQITALSTFQTLLQCSAKHAIIYIPTFIPPLFVLYQSLLSLNRSTYLLSNINFSLLQQHLLSTFAYLLQTYSLSVFPHNILNQFIPVILFDLMTYIHDLTRVQHQYKLVTISKEVNDQTKGLNHGDHTSNKLTIPLSRVVQTISATKSSSFSTPDPSTPSTKHSSASVLTGASSFNNSPAQATLTNPSRAVLTPHILHVPTFHQQQSREVVMVDILNFLTSLLTTTTSSLLLPNDIFVAIARSVVMIIHTFLTPQGGCLLPFPTPIMMRIFVLLNQLAQFTPRAGCLSPLLGEAMIYFTWLLHSPTVATELQQFAKQALSQLAVIVSPAMIVPALPLETILSLDQLRDRTFASLASHIGITDSTDSRNTTSSISSMNQFSFNNSPSSQPGSSTTTTTTTPFGSLDPNHSFPLLLYPFQQGVLNTDASPSSLEEYMLSTYHSYTRNINISISSSQHSGVSVGGNTSSSPSITSMFDTHRDTFQASSNHLQAPVEFSAVQFEETSAAEFTNSGVDPGFVLQTKMSEDSDSDAQTQAKPSKQFTAPASFLTDLSNIDDDDDLDLAIDFAG